MKMMEFKSEIANIEDWISAFNPVGSSIVKDDTKASSWAQSNPNSSNLHGDRSQRDNDWHKHKAPGMIIITNKPLGVITHIKTWVN